MNNFKARAAMRSLVNESCLCGHKGCRNPYSRDDSRHRDYCAEFILSLPINELEKWRRYAA